jgi:dTDP-glucose 4,6-dehydratase
MYRREFGVDTAIARIFNTYGPRMRPDDGRLVPTFISQALEGVPLTIAGDGTQTRSLCHVDDLVEGLLLLLASDQAGPMNLGNPDEMTVIDTARLILRLTRSCSPLAFVPLPEDDPQQRQPDIGLAERTLGWTPKTPAEVGMRWTIDWFAERVSVGA